MILFAIYLVAFCIALTKSPYYMRKLLEKKDNGVTYIHLKL